MKKIVLIVALIVLALSVIGVTVAFAQGGQPPFGAMMRGHGYGPTHDYIEKALAAKLSLTEQQVEDQLAAGQPMFQIALDNGIEQGELANLMNEVHEDAFSRAVKDGVVTQEQADWMLQRMQAMFQRGNGPGTCPMYRGQGEPFGRGRGFGRGMMAGMWGQGAESP